MPERVRRALAAAVLAVAAGWVWSGIYAGASAGRLAGLAALAALPAVARWWWGRRTPPLPVAALTVVGIAGCLAIAVRQSPWQVLTLGQDARDAIGRLVRDGMVEANQAVAPVAWGQAPAFSGMLDLVFALQVASIAGGVLVRGRPVSAVVAVLAGCAYRWTVAPTGEPIAEGAVMLAAAVAAVWLARLPQGHGLRARGRLGGVLVGAVAVAIAGVAAGAVGDRAPWWRWQSWGIDGSRAAEVGTLSLAQEYGQLHWPDEPRPVMRIRTPTPLPMAAMTLNGFDGISFVQTPDDGIPVVMSGGSGVVDIAPPGAPSPVTQTVTLERTRTTVLFRGGHVLRLDGAFTGSVDVQSQGAVVVNPAVGPDFRYRVEVLVNDPAPALLRQSAGYLDRGVPPGTTTIQPYGSGGGPVDVPLWPAGRDADLPPGALGDYDAVRSLTRRVVGDARQPYVAVNRVESYLRANYAYDEAPRQVPGAAPINAFLFDTRRGFCQHFAGSMALMLRSVGIPSRIVVGYTAGRYEAASDTWMVVDRDAHAWVQVWMPGGVGWVDFDPTPGRYYPNRVSVGSPDYQPPPVTGRPEEDVAREPVNPPRITPPSPPEPATPTPAPEPTVGVPERGTPAIVWALLAGLALAALAVSPAITRALRRRAARTRGDARERVLAAVRDFEDDVSRLGFAPPTHLDAPGRASHVRDTLGSDPGELYALAQHARYAADPGPSDAPVAAWRHVRRLRREIHPKVARGRRLKAFLGLSQPQARTWRQAPPPPRRSRGSRDRR